MTSRVFRLLCVTVIATGLSPALLASQSAGVVRKDIMAPAPPADVVTHDNREPVGTTAGKIHSVRLEVVRGFWRPEGADGPMREVFAFAEEGKAPNIPGPLIRVPEGTELRVFVRNRLPVSVKLHGLVPRPAAKDEFVVMTPGKGLEFRFKVGAPGTYYYWGQTKDSSFLQRTGEDSQLNGALIVDSPATAENPDRVFVISEWLGPVPPAGTPRKLSIAVNGRSWPHTERLTIPFGLAVEWRVINATVAPHPMHLHGTFYTVESRGTATRDVVYGAPNRRLVTTELMTFGTTMMMRWVPDRVGNWLFHCHILAHVTGRMRDGDALPGEHAEHAEHDIERAMAGLVLGITVQPGDETAAPDLETRVRKRKTLYVRETPNRYGELSGYGFAFVNERAPAPAPVAGASPSPPIVLTKGEPVVIGVENGIDQSLAIHWHGIELESFNDGVPGWSGQSGQIMPPVEPGKSFDVHFTPPRAGTFMYHTHGHDSRQLVSGMYGALIVTEPGKTFDPAVDHIVLLGGAGPGAPGVELNRSTKPAPMELKAGVKHRFRFINITPNFTLQPTLRSDNGPVQWRAVAKDGADLPPNQSTMRPALFTIGVGETYDFEFEPSATGEYRLDVLRVGTGAMMVTAPVRVVR
jgi:FtsP/CotA-like multicopper oxidase with cupredoxin domain